MYRSFRKIKILFATFRKSLLSMLESSLFWLLERATRMQLWAFKFHGNPRIPVRVRTHTRRPGIIVRVQLHAEQRFSRRIIPRCVCTYLKFPSRWMDSHACIDYDEIHVNTHTHTRARAPTLSLTHTRARTRTQSAWYFARSKRWKLNHIIKFLLSGMLARRKWRFALSTTCAHGRPCRDRAPNTDRQMLCPLGEQHQLIRPGMCGTAAVTWRSRSPPRPREPPARIPRSWTPAAPHRTSVSPSRRCPSGCGNRVVCSIAVA